MFTAHLQLPITALLQRMPASFQVESLTADVDQAVRDFVACSLELISCGYPKPPNLQAEQLRHIQLLQFAIYHLQIAVTREDLAHQMFIYNAINGIVKTLHLLSYFGYVMQVRSYYIWHVM